jgi:hypothetical protein
MIVKIAFFWDVTPRDSCENRRFGGTSIIATLHNIPEGGILHSHSRENLKFYFGLTGWTL